MSCNDDECKQHNICEKDYIWNPAACSCENCKYLTNTMDDSVVMCDEIVESYNEETKTIPTNFNKEKANGKTHNFYILLAFSLITITLLIAVSIYCYLINYQVKQKHLLPFYITNNELKELMY